MDRALESIASFPSLLVPMLVLWAIVGLYSLRSGVQCVATQILYFAILLFVSLVTVRTVVADDGYWLPHTASLGTLIVAGVMRRPETANPIPFN